MRRVDSRLLAVFAALAILASSSCADGGSEPNGGPSPSAQDSSSLRQSLGGSRWTMEYDYEDVHRRYDFVLQESGKVRSYSDRDDTHHDDSWRLSGRQLSISMNNGRVVYTAEVSGSDVRELSGMSENYRGESWPWTATRVAE